jgi:hypothetical protein
MFENGVLRIFGPKMEEDCRENCIITTPIIRILWEIRGDKMAITCSARLRHGEHTTDISREA